MIAGSRFKKGKIDEEPGKPSKLGVRLSESKSSSLEMFTRYRVRENRDANEKVESAKGIVRKKNSPKMTSLIIWTFLRNGMYMQ